MYAAKTSPEEKINIPAKVGRSKEAHKIMKVLNIVFFINIYMPQIK